MTDSVLAQIAVLAKASLPELKAQWRDLFGPEPPGINRAYLERRIAYRLQELAYGGLPDATRMRLDALAKTADKGSSARTTRTCSGSAYRRYQAASSVAGSRTQRHRAADRLRLPRPLLRQPIGGRAPHHWQQVERPSFLRTSGPAALMAPVLKRRCAVYTRKSTDEGLDMAFNSLDAQREACEAYVASQRGEGWVLEGDRYDDGGYSGGNLERPALKRLLDDIQAGKIDCVVVYKIDRLTRSLMDFSRLVDLFDKGSVTFVSVTQSFNTTTSMGRLTLNILLSFAQFERELGSERVRDKIAASKRRGLWTGGVVPLG